METKDRKREPEAEPSEGVEHDDRDADSSNVQKAGDVLEVV